MYFNEQTILGFTGQAAEVTQFKNGTQVTKFSVATKINRGKTKSPTTGKNAPSGTTSWRTVTHLPN